MLLIKLTMSARVCVYVSVCDRERERERQHGMEKL